MTGSRDRTIKMWDLRMGSAINSLKKHTSIVECLRFHGDTLVSGGDDRYKRKEKNHAGFTIIDSCL